MRTLVPHLLRSLPCAALVVAFVACSPEALESPAPESGGAHPELAPYALALEVDVATARVRAVAPAGSGTSEGLAYSLLGNAEVAPTIGNITRSPVVNGRVAFRFDVTLTSLLNSGNLVTPTFPIPPAGVQGLLLIPFQVRDKQGPGTVRNGPEWDGLAHNFFNDVTCTATSGGNDCYPYKLFPAPLGPLASTSAQTVGFNIDSRVRSFTVLMILAADIQNTPLPPAASGAIAGRVTSPAAGALRGVTVTAGRESPVTTDVAGGYQVTGVPVGGVSVSLGNLPSGCVAPSPQTAVVLPGGLATADFSVDCPAPPVTTGTVAGTVTSPALGNLYGVIAVVNPGGRGGATDGAGAYAIPGVAAGQVTVTLSNLPAGCVNPGAQPVTVTAGTSVPVNFSVNCGGTTGPGTGTITGTLHGSAGPLADVQVTMQPGNLTATTDPSGVFRFRDLTPGTVLLTFSNLPTGCANPGSQAVEIIAGRGAVLNLQVPCAPVGGIRGTLRDADGAPVVAAEVTAEADGALLRTVSGSDGGFGFAGLTPGAWVVTAEKPPTCPRVSSPVTVSASAEASANLVMSCPAQLALTFSAIPSWAVSGMTFHVVDPQGIDRLTAPMTQSPFHVRASVSGAWRVTFPDLIAGCVVSGPATIQAVQQQEVPGNFTVICPTGLIAGTVTDLDGAPVSGARLIFTRGAYLLSAVTDADGRYFSTDLIAGTWQATVSKFGTCNPDASPLTVTDGQAVAYSPALDCPPRVMGNMIAVQGALPEGLTAEFRSPTAAPVSIPAVSGKYEAILTPGDWFVRAGNVPSNCQVLGERPMVLAQQSRVTNDFHFDCSPATGIVITPGSYDFGDVGVGVATPTTFTLTNNGPVTDGTTSLEMFGDTDFRMSGTNCAGGFALAAPPGGSCTFSLTFTAASAGPRSATLVIHLASGTTISLQLRGTGVTGPIRLSITPSPFDFGSVAVGASAQQVFTVSNTGPVPTGPLLAAMHGGNTQDFVPAGFLGDPNSTCLGGLTTGLAPGQSCTLTFRFSPLGVGPRSARLALEGGGGELVSLPLSGTGQ